MSQHLKELRERQARLFTEARAKYDEIKQDTPEERAAELEREHDAIMAEVDKLQARVDREERMAAFEARLAADDPRAPRYEDRQADPRGREPEREQAVDAMQAFKRFLQGGAAGLSTEERSALRPMSGEVRAQSTAGGEGGYTVPEGFFGEIEKALAMTGPMLDERAVRVVRTDTGAPLVWPAFDTTAISAAKQTEGNAVSDTDLVDAEKQLDAYTYMATIPVSLQLLQDSAFNWQTEIINPAFQEIIGRKVNTELTVGDGTGDPNGVVTASALGKAAVATAAIASDELLDLQHSVDPLYRSTPKCAWMFNDTTALVIRKLKDGEGNYLWQMGDITRGQSPLLLGKPVWINQAMPAMTTGQKPIVFGDLGKYITRLVRDVAIIRLNERFMEKLQVGFVSYLRADGELSQTKAVKHLVMA